MSEYVVRGAVPNHTVRVEDEREVYWHMTHLPVLEEIVRCGDCKFCMSYWGADYCDHFSHVTNDPDGFCAWGERRADHD